MQLILVAEFQNAINLIAKFQNATNLIAKLQLIAFHPCTCIMKTQSVKVVMLLPHRIKDQIEEGKTIAKKCIADKHTLIAANRSDWFIKVTEEWN